MRHQQRAAKSAPMSADAYAGFLKLMLTPISRVPEMTPDLEAYLQYLNQREPLSQTAQRAVHGASKKQAA